MADHPYLGIRTLVYRLHEPEKSANRLARSNRSVSEVDFFSRIKYKVELLRGEKVGHKISLTERIKDMQEVWSWFSDNWWWMVLGYTQGWMFHRTVRAKKEIKWTQEEIQKLKDDRKDCWKAESNCALLKEYSVPSLEKRILVLETLEHERTRPLK
jgi:hypothetical protein